MTHLNLPATSIKGERPRGRLFVPGHWSRTVCISCGRGEDYITGQLLHMHGGPRPA